MLGYSSTHFRTSFTILCLSSRPFLPVFVSEIFCCRCDRGILSDPGWHYRANTAPNRRYRATGAGCDVLVHRVTTLFSSLSFSKD